MSGNQGLMKHLSNMAAPTKSTAPTQAKTGGAAQNVAAGKNQANVDFKPPPRI